MYCISMNHKAADADVRGTYSFDRQEQEVFYQEAAQLSHVNGVVVLMTCNRNEIYFTGCADGMNEIEHLYAKIKGVSVSEIRTYFMRYHEERALLHLYRVACGLDSAILGEVEIIHQLKSAYKMADQLGKTDREIHICFQGALNLAKDVAENCQMTRLPVSTGTLVAETVMEQVCNIDSPVILIVGAGGNIGSIVLKNLADLSKKMHIIGTSRKHSEELSQRFHYDCTQFIPYEKRYDYLDMADVIISATTSPHYTFIVNEVQNRITEENQPKLFIDLAVPKDIDPDIEYLNGCTIYNIDYIKEIAKENNRKKYSEAEKIQLLIQEKVEELRKNLLFREYRTRDRIKERLADKNVAGLLYQLRDDLDYEAFKKVLETMMKEENDGIFSLYD